MSDTFRYVRIIKMPIGEAPSWVREQWVGVILPDLGPASGERSYGLLTGKPLEHDSGCVVPMLDAIVALGLKCPEAAQWFIEHLGRTRIEYGTFLFQRDECEPVPEPARNDDGPPIQQICTRRPDR